MLRSIGKQSGKQIVAANLLPHSLMYAASRPRHQGNQCRIIVPVLATCYLLYSYYRLLLLCLPF